MSKKTFGMILDENKGFGPGFDFARVFLAFSVLAWHSPAIVNGNANLNTWTWIFNYSILPMFFGLSGFLVAGSAQRLSLGNFAINRGMRIFPALIVEIILSAFFLGLIFTSFTFSHYFTDAKLYKYLLNIFGIIHYTLPGVFLNNPFPQVVNGSLWTVPLELICYFVMAVLIITGFIKKPLYILIFAVLSIIFGITLQSFVGDFPQYPIIDKILSAYLHGDKGSILLPCFLLGAATYTLRHKIPYSIPLLIASTSFIILFGIIGNYKLWSYTIVPFIISPILIYIVVFVGLTNMPKLPYFSRGDYSYGIYLYGFPIQQAIISTFPGMNSWILHLFISALIVTMFATFSWHFIEKPILKLRKHFSVKIKSPAPPNSEQANLTSSSSEISIEK